MAINYNQYMDKNDNWIKQLRKGIFELAILLILSKQDFYGYDLTNKLNTIPFFTMANGSIYPILKKLENNGYISSYWGSTEIIPRRKYYKITRKGEEVLKQRLEIHSNLHESLNILKKGCEDNDS